MIWKLEREYGQALVWTVVGGFGIGAIIVIVHGLGYLP